MDAAETCYISMVKSTFSIGRILFLPYCCFQITFQTIKFLVMNVLSYVRLLFVYNWNLLHVMRESEHDINTFHETYQQRIFNNRHRIRNNSLPVEANVKNFFDPPTNISQYFSKMWFRTGYYYDRYIINYPFDFLNGSTSSYHYNPFEMQNNDIKQENKTTTPSSLVLNNSHSPDGQETIFKINFVPKPYVITESLKKGENNKSFSTQLINTCPVLSGVLIDQSEKHESINIAKENLSLENKDDFHNKDHYENKEENEINQKTENKFFYKIKIRKKNLKSDLTNHPTYERYDLLSQAIKNIIPQPSYLPEQTIGPNLIRFAWHCCAHYDMTTGTGGSSGGTMRFAQEFNDLGNTGLTTSKSYLDQVHENFPWISFADLYTYAGCVAIEAIGGPKIQWKPGRTDCPDARKVPPMGRLPVATKDYSHIQEVFYNRLGFNAQETVALIGGGHGIGGCHARYSGFNGIWTKNPFKWDNDFFKVLLNENWSLGIVPQTGNEQYYNDDKTLMMLNTDIELLRCSDFKKWVEIYAENETLFNEHFSLAFAKLLELGVIRDDDGIQRAKI